MLAFVNSKIVKLKIGKNSVVYMYMYVRVALASKSENLFRELAIVLLSEKFPGGAYWKSYGYYVLLSVANNYVAHYRRMALTTLYTNSSK